MRNEKLGKIEKIIIYPEKGKTGRELAEGRLIENLGLEGDFYAKGGDRQITLLVRGNGDENKIREEGLCVSRFRENISISGLSPDLLKSGLRLSLGEAVLEISDEIKHCHEECPLFQKGKHCSLAGMNLFARVLKGGAIKVGDVIGITL